MLVCAGVIWVYSSHWTVPVPFAQSVTPLGGTALTFSGSQGFLALISGLVLAFAFQLLLANFFIALGISYSDHSDAHDEQRSSDDVEYQINQIGTVVGLRTLGTVSLTLFMACLLAVKLSSASNILLGAILGLVIWATYFSMLVWISATTVGSVIGSVLNKATSGLQGIVSAVAVTLSAKSVSNQVGSTAEASVEAVRRKLSEAVDPVEARSAISKYLQKLQLSEAERQEIQREFETLVADPEMKAIAKKNHLDQIRRTTFVDLVTSRTEFSKQDINWVLERLDNVWQQWSQPPQTNQGNGLTMLLSEAPDKPNSLPLSTKLEQLLEQTRQQQARRQAEAAQKVAETAAWWLFGTAFTSAAASALAGVLSVRF